MLTRGALRRGRWLGGWRRNGALLLLLVLEFVYFVACFSTLFAVFGSVLVGSVRLLLYC